MMKKLLLGFLSLLLSLAALGIGAAIILDFRQGVGLVGQLPTLSEGRLQVLVFFGIVFFLVICRIIYGPGKKTKIAPRIDRTPADTGGSRTPDVRPESRPSTEAGTAASGGGGDGGD